MTVSDKLYTSSFKVEKAAFVERDYGESEASCERELLPIRLFLVLKTATQAPKKPISGTLSLNNQLIVSNPRTPPFQESALLGLISIFLTIKTLS